MKNNICRRICIFGLLLACGVASAQSSASRNYRVDCGVGHKLGVRLAFLLPGSTVRVSGVCKERIVITADDVTIDGEGTAILEGEGPGPVPQPLESVVTIDGATGVAIKNLTVRGGAGNGIMAVNGASFRLEGVTTRQNTFGGVVVGYNATAELEDFTSQANLIGLDVFGGASVLMTGAIDLTENMGVGMDAGGPASVELRGAQLDVSKNGGIGMGVSQTAVQVFAYPEAQGASITANSNGFCGVVIENGGALSLFSPPPFLGTDVNVITAKDNRVCGFSLPHRGSVFAGAGETAQIVVVNNPFGMVFGESSSMSIPGGLQIANNGTGILADGAGAIRVESVAENPSSVAGNTTADVDARFGSRVTLCGLPEAAVLNDGMALVRTPDADCGLLPGP